MSSVRDRLDALWQGSQDMRALRYVVTNDPGQLDVLDDGEVGRLYASAQLGRYSMSELCKALERYLAGRPPKNEETEHDDHHDENDAGRQADCALRG